MDLFRYFVRFLYKIRWYLVILPLIALIVAWFLTRNMERIYDANTTIYTGMITATIWKVAVLLVATPKPTSPT